MGIINAPHILFGKVMHARLFPKVNKFLYGIYYISLPLSKLDHLPLAYNRFAPLSFFDKDHGACDGSNLDSWARSILREYGIDQANGEIVLVCMPRIFGYVFNPVSFWLCHDRSGHVRAVICEVHNTFGEKHSYLCAFPDQRPIVAGDVLKGEKIFHVSPFLEREGHYTFRFNFEERKFSALIDFYDAEGKKKLVTSLIGQHEIMEKHSLRKAFWHYPLVTMKSITLIHWEAIRLVAKGIKYISKPIQKKATISTTNGLESAD